LRVSLT